MQEIVDHNKLPIDSHIENVCEWLRAIEGPTNKAILVELEAIQIKSRNLIFQNKQLRKNYEKIKRKMDVYKVQLKNTIRNREAKDVCKN